ncbi:MAG: hypothetical protein NWR72_21510 [Bacteroidia bacterium]|nr:hypothetical protein [Bacteroidia bacterium]
MKALRSIGHGLLAILLLTSVTGLTVHKHFCLGKQVSVSLLNNGNDCMPMPQACEGKSEQGDFPDDSDQFRQVCCDDLYQHVQVESEFDCTQLAWAPLDLQVLPIASLVLPIKEAPRPAFFPTDPPSPEPNELFARHQVFRL